MPHSPEALAAALRRQAGFYAELGSPLWSEAMAAVAADIEAGGRFARLLAGWDGDLERGVLPLRLFGGFHYLALAGKAPTLAAQLPSTGGTRDGALWTALCEALAQHEDLLRGFLDHPPQTNEIGRSAIFLGGFLEIAARSGLPLALCETGASAGLNLCWDRFDYRLGAHRWTGTDPVLMLTVDWRGPPPRLDLRPVVASRQACDLRPIRLAEPEARLRLEGYVWPDHLDRLTHLRAAMTLAREMEITVETADAMDWLAQRLAARPEGQVMVIYHSVMLQYFDKVARSRFAAMIAAAGAEATESRPLAWLSYELASDKGGYDLHLAYWPGDAEGPWRRRLAAAQPHGRWIDWQG